MPVDFTVRHVPTTPPRCLGTEQDPSGGRATGIGILVNLTLDNRSQGLAIAEPLRPFPGSARMVQPIPRLHPSPGNCPLSAKESAEFGSPLEGEAPAIRECVGVPKDNR